MRFSYVPKGYTNLFNVDPRRPVLKTKVGIFGAFGLDLVLDDGYNLNYITPEVVVYLGLPRLPMTYPYTKEVCKVTEGVKASFTHGNYYEEVWCDIMPMASCHLSLWANWFNEHKVPNEKNGYKCVVDHWGTPLFPLSKVKNERQKIERIKGKQGGNLRVEKREVERSEVRGLPQSQSNISVHPSLGKDSYVGTSMMNGGTQVPNKETTIEGVMDALMGCPNIQFDPIDDRIDSSSKIDLSPPSVNTYALKDSSLSCDSCVDQPTCECSSLVEGSCNVIKKPQFGGTNDNVDHLNRSDSLSISSIKGLIACFAHRDHVLENASKNDMCPFEGELACFHSSLVVDHSLFKYNILFEDDEITPTDVPSGVNLESSVVLDNYTFYSDPLWCEAYPPKDGNLFLEDESTLVGKDCDEEEGGVCFSLTSSSWCVPIVNGMTHEFEPIRSHTHENTLDGVCCWKESAHLINGGALDPSLWMTFPFDPGSELNCGICVGMPGRNERHMVGDIVDSFPYAGKLFLRFYHPPEGPTLCVGRDNFQDPFSISYSEHDLVDCASYGGRRYLHREGEVCTFLYYLFACDEIPSWIISAVHVDQGIIEFYTCGYDPVLWTFYHFDPSESLKVFDLVGVSPFGWYYHVDEKNNHCPCSPFVGLIAMKIEDVWLFLEFETPRLNVLSAYLCTIHHAKRM
ncbi:hypothetical protein KY290_008011 [Solanum tuberosum]|uniref:Uncharacterized protein n=1 Tax=Solanum tuberosum TaxID=4113 RepID=A0ABQ7W7N6_SOLTU|nr:hypothetical protein KY290_008011 [Solanum tuberosum]